MSNLDSFWNIKRIYFYLIALSGNMIRLIVSKLVMGFLLWGFWYFYSSSTYLTICSTKARFSIQLCKPPDRIIGNCVHTIPNQAPKKVSLWNRPQTFYHSKFPSYSLLFVARKIAGSQCQFIENKLKLSKHLSRHQVERQIVHRSQGCASSSIENVFYCNEFK